MQELHVRSLFNREMDVTGITSVPPDPQVSYEHRREHDTITLRVARISPLNTSSIGLLRFNPTVGCRNQCYLGISPNSTSKEAVLSWMEKYLECLGSSLYLSI
jgi:hypothetical protein